MPPFQFFPDFLSDDQAQVYFEHLCREHDFSQRGYTLPDGTVLELATGSLALVEPGLDDPEILSRHFNVWVEFDDVTTGLKDKVESLTGHSYQICNIILYDDGMTGIDFHQDFAAYGDVDSIPSLSLGATREFALRRVSDHSDFHSFSLKSGALVVMGNDCQNSYEHGLMVDDSITEPRFNLTFRKYKNSLKTTPQ